MIRLIRRLLFGNALVSIPWQIKVNLRNQFTDKIRVGFGPITTGENDFAERKWRIDPIINRINEIDGDYAAGFFISPKEMKNFDLIVIVKKFNPSFLPFIAELKRKNRRFIYDIVDNPNSGKKYRYYFGDHSEFSGQMDAFILSSPLQEEVAHNFSPVHALIEHPVIDDSYKEAYAVGEEIRILAQGYAANLRILKGIEPIIRDVSASIGKKIHLVYHSEEVFPDTEWVKHVRWTPKNCFKEMLKADIAITVKNLDTQKTKPSTKVISYMAAGLPVICTPTEADRLVIEEGVTGLFAFQPLEWKKHLTELALDAKRREEIGTAARKSAREKYSIDVITQKYLALLERIR